MNQLFREPTSGVAPLPAGDIGSPLVPRDHGLALAELRKRCAMTQGELAEKLAIGRPAVCKLERRADMHVSNLRRYVEALGGTLAITAHFPDGAVAIADVGEPVR